MITLDETSLRQLQMIELEMLIEVDRICKKCDIRYHIIGGTLLGSVRHKGFIPWDDDADVALLRSEYERFREACRTELDTERFYFQDYSVTPGYRWSYGKIRRKGTLFLREHQEHMPYEQGVFIDIFPVDGIPDDFILRKIHESYCFCLRKILWAAVGRLSDKSGFKRRWFSILYRIPEEKVLKCYARMAERNNRKRTKRVRIALMPFPGKRNGYLREWFEESGDFVFEDYILQGIKKYREFLTFEFGNYMSLPPVGERKVHPVSDIKLIEAEVRKDNI